MGTWFWWEAIPPHNDILGRVMSIYEDRRNMTSVYSVGYIQIKGFLPFSLA